MTSHKETWQFCYCGELRFEMFIRMVFFNVNHLQSSASKTLSLAKEPLHQNIYVVFCLAYEVVGI